MNEIKRNRNKEVIYERDMEMISDYKSGEPLDEILKKYKIRSKSTIYNAIDRVNKRLREEKK